MATFENSQDASLSPLTCSAEDSPARISPRPGNAPASKALALAYGLSSPAWLGFFDPDTFLLKTSQACLIDGQCRELSENWPDSGMWESGDAFELQTSEPPTLENESSSWRTADQTENARWPTPNVPNGGRTSNATDRRADGSKRQIDLGALAMRWPTPRREDGESCGNHPMNGEGPNSHNQISGQWRDAMDRALTQNCWQTPGTDSFRSRGGDRKDEQGLDQQARMFWQTPQARDHKSGESKADYGNTRPLNEQVATWPTPQACSPNSLRGEGQDDLQDAVTVFPHSPPAPPIQDGEISSESAPSLPRRLNPQFVEWLQGFPIGWTRP